jgi:hypothetical protein
MARPTGRPTVLTKTLQKRIAECFLVAFTDAQTAEYCSIDQKTIQRIRRDDRFCPAVKKAELAREMHYRRKIWDGVGYWQGAAWFLERKYPTQFSKPEVQLQVTNQIGPQFNNVTILAPRIARELQAREVVLDAEVTELLGSDQSPNGKSA